MYSQHEALARERMRERRSVAAHRRLERQLSAGRRWQWLSNYAARQAARSRQAHADGSAGSYELVG